MNNFNVAKIKIQPQECGGESKFKERVNVSSGFQIAFRDDVFTVVNHSLHLIRKNYVQTPDGADYLQCFVYEALEYWCIDEENHITFLLPEEY